MNFIKFLKEYLPLIIIVPTFLGGIWQVFELSFMSISFIRFFSITQLVADGILLIIVIFPWIIGLIFLIGIHNSIKKYNSISENDILFFLFMMIIYSITIVTVYDNTIKLGTDNYFSYLFIIAFIYLFFCIVVFSLNKFFVKSINFFSNAYKRNKLLYTILIIFFLYILVHNLFFIPKNLENISNLPQGKIKYFNDKYIFIENEENKKILVEKFDKLFKE